MLRKKVVGTSFYSAIFCAVAGELLLFLSLVMNISFSCLAVGDGYVGCGYEFRKGERGEVKRND